MKNYFAGIIFATLLTSATAHADANYSLTCSVSNGVATVYACNLGDSSEGNNEYVTVTACGNGSCDSDYDLFYIYASSGQCDAVGSITFDSEYSDYCVANFR